MATIQVIRDNRFKTGVYVMRPGFDDGDPRATERYLDYCGTAKKEDDRTWVLAQWGTRLNFGNCTERLGDDGFYYYEDAVRTFAVNPETGAFKMDLNGSAIYGDTPRTPDEAWGHILVEQGFTHVQKLTNVKAIYATLDFELTRFEDRFADPSQCDPGVHAAQLLWYFTINNILTPEQQAEGNLGRHNDYIWFGVPLFDNRTPIQKESWQFDKGTGQFIYGLGNDLYLPGPAEVGKRMRFTVDIAPYMRRALEIVQGEGGMKDVLFENLAFTYFNFGWELPGTYDVGATIYEINVEIVEE